MVVIIGQMASMLTAESLGRLVTGIKRRRTKNGKRFMLLKVNSQEYLAQKEEESLTHTVCWKKQKIVPNSMLTICD